MAAKMHIAISDVRKFRLQQTSPFYLPFYFITPRLAEIPSEVEPINQTNSASPRHSLSIYGIIGLGLTSSMSENLCKLSYPYLLSLDIWAVGRAVEAANS